MKKTIKLLKESPKLPLLFSLINKSDLYPLERNDIQFFKSERTQTKLRYTFPSNKPIAKILNIKDGKIL